MPAWQEYPRGMNRKSLARQLAQRLLVQPRLTVCGVQRFSANFKRMVVHPSVRYWYSKCTISVQYRACADGVGSTQHRHPVGLAKEANSHKAAALCHLCDGAMLFLGDRLGITARS